MTNTKVICKLTPELDAKRTKRTGLQIGALLSPLKPLG